MCAGITVHYAFGRPTSLVVQKKTSLPVSPLLGPRLIVNLSSTNSQSISIQIFGTEYLNTTVYYLLNTTLNLPGTYTFILPSSFYAISNSYVKAGFGRYNTGSLIAMAYNNANGNPFGFNNIDFNPYSVNIVNMSVEGNLTFLAQWFKNTNINPEQYSAVIFGNLTLYVSF